MKLDTDKEGKRRERIVWLCDVVTVEGTPDRDQTDLSLMSAA